MTVRKTFFSLGILLLASSLLTSAQNNPIPTIDLPLTPAQALPGSAGLTLIVRGTGFVSGSTVNWDGSPRTTTVVSSSQVSAAINASDLAVTQSASVTVSNPSPGGGVSNPAYFEVTTGASSVQYVASSFGFPSDQGGTAIGDFDHDGKLDLAIIQQSGSSSLLLLLGNGDGTFQPPLTQDLGDNSPNSVATTDFNHDGNLDLVTANLNGTISVLLGNGDGTFQFQIDSPSGLGSQGVAVGDFNGDGDEDVAVTSNPPFAVSVLLGLGDGTFRPAIGYPVLGTPASLAAGDFNNDGKLDLVVSSFSGGGTRISVFLGNGDGTFQSGMDAGSEAYGPMVVADFNNDGNLDLAVGFSRYIYIFKGIGNGVFNTPTKLSAKSTPDSLAIGDLNGDGIVDIAFSGENVGVFLGKGDGTFRTGRPFTGLSGAVPLAAGDFNNDGVVDIGTSTGVLMGTTATVSSASLNFGTILVGTMSKPVTISLKNLSGSALAVSGITISGDFSETNTCGTSVPPLSACRITVTFDPLSLGTLNGTLTISDSAFGGTQTVSLTGTGAAPAVSLSPTSLTFGAQQVGTTSLPQYVSLTNTGDTLLTIATIVASGDFAQINSCGTKLPSRPGLHFDRYIHSDSDWNANWSNHHHGQRTG